MVSSDSAIIKSLISEAVNKVSSRSEACEQKLLKETSVRGNGVEDICHSFLALSPTNCINALQEQEQIMHIALPRCNRVSCWCFRYIIA